jgi:hypothetical protein
LLDLPASKNGTPVTSMVYDAGGQRVKKMGLQA